LREREGEKDEEREGCVEKDKQRYGDTKEQKSEKEENVS
jgi:hypothetical protein